MTSSLLWNLSLRAYKPVSAQPSGAKMIERKSSVEAGLPVTTCTPRNLASSSSGLAWPGSMTTIERELSAVSARRLSRGKVSSLRPVKTITPRSDLGSGRSACRHGRHRLQDEREWSAVSPAGFVAQGVLKLAL